MNPPKCPVEGSIGSPESTVLVKMIFSFGAPEKVVSRGVRKTERQRKREKDGKNEGERDSEKNIDR